MTEQSIEPTLPFTVTTPVDTTQTPPVGPSPDVQELDRKLDQLEQLATELHEEVGPPAAQPWPAAFYLSIIVPVYNECDTIEQMLTKLQALDLPKEIIVIDDGSTDGTQEVLAAWHNREDVSVVLKRVNEGKGAAIRTGFAHVEGSVVIVQDADLEYDPTEIPALMQPIVSGKADVVYGSRFLESRSSGSSALHQLGNRLLTALSNWTTGLELTDMETCYKAFPAALLNEMEVRQNRFGFEPEITAKMARRDLRIVELPVRYQARDWSDGKKIGWRDAISAIYCIFRYAWVD